MRKMDWMDFVFKFSGEIMVLSLAILVGALNLFYFSGNSKESFKDESIAGNFLLKHYSLNPKLFAKNNSIVTVINQNSGFVQRAYADDFIGLDNMAPVPTENSDTPVFSDENSILAPNPDSIQGLVNNAVKQVYTTKDGDTLKSISQQYGVSVDSIRWSNPSLTSTSLQPGWHLIIPPVEGIAVTATDNDTLPDLATRYNPERYNKDTKIRDALAAEILQKIIYYNGLDSAEDISGGDFIVIPGGVIAVPPVVPTPKPTPKPGKTPSNSKIPSYDQGLDTVTSISGGYDATNHTFPKGYCTYYVATRMKITFGGNAKNWLANARASGYVVSNEPAPHTAVVMTGPHGAMRRYGHVAYVEEVVEDKILVSEMNFEHFNRVNQRWININDPTLKGYIYP